jgi:acyl-CoA thioester hydrolase
MVAMAEPALVLPPAGPSLAGDGGGLTDLTAFPVLRPVTPRYSDLGGDRHVTTVALTRWLEEARVQAELPRFRALVQDGGGRFRIVLAAQRLRALAPVPRGAEYRIGLGVRRIGGSSFSYGYGVFAGDRCVAVADSVTVVATGSGPSELPGELRADLATMVIDEPGGAAAPRPEQARRDRTRYPAVHRLTSRIGDVDTNRHVNNVAILSWYADAVAAWQSGRLGDPDGGPPEELAATAWEVQYVDEVAHPRTYDVVLAVDAAADGLHYRAGLFSGERCVGLADGFGAAGPLDPAGAGLRP